MSSLLRERVTRWKRRLRGRRASSEIEIAPSTLFHAAIAGSAEVPPAAAVVPLVTAPLPAPTPARRRTAPQRLSIHATTEDLEAWLRDGQHHWAEVPHVESWLDKVLKPQEQQRLLYMLDAVLVVACHTRLHRVLQIPDIFDAPSYEVYACRPAHDAASRTLRFELWKKIVNDEGAKQWERWWIDFSLDTFQHPPPTVHETHRVSVQHPHVHRETISSWMECFLNLERVPPPSREALAQHLLANFLFPSAGDPSWMYHLDPAAKPTPEEQRIAARFSTQMRRYHADKLDALRLHHSTRIHVHASTSEAEHVRRSLPQFILGASTQDDPWTFVEVVLMVLGHAHQGIREHRLYALRAMSSGTGEGFHPPKLLRSVLTTNDPSSGQREYHLTIGSFLQTILSRAHGQRGGIGVAASVPSDCFVTTSLGANLTVAVLSQLTHAVDATAHLSLGRQLSLDERHTLEMLLKILVHQRAESVIESHPSHSSPSAANSDRMQACMSVLSALDRQMDDRPGLSPVSSTATAAAAGASSSLRPSSPVEEIMQRLRNLAALQQH
jgi:hypothetical protein